EITNSIKTNNEIKNLIDDSILNQDDKNELHNLRKQKLYEKIFNEIEREEKISDLFENNKFDKLIQDSDLINQQKKILQNNRNRRLNLLQVNLFEYYKKTIQQTIIVSILQELHKEISKSNISANNKLILYDLIKEKIDTFRQEE
ncbi:15541_t:CDS:1, partial [Racocetra persica]